MNDTKLRAKEKRIKSGSIAMVIGLVLMTAAIVLAMYNIWDSSRARGASEEVLTELHKKMSGKDTSEVFENNEELWMPGIVTEDSAKKEMAVEEIDGNEYIGVVEIPSLSISLPVMKDWDYDKLKTAPCAYSGSYYTNDLVIAGHNYTSHFGPLTRLAPNDDVYFITVDGISMHYIVDYIETVQPTAISKMIEKDGWDLTLFTCTLGGQTRCTVRCIHVD